MHTFAAMELVVLSVILGNFKRITRTILSAPNFFTTSLVEDELAPRISGEGKATVGQKNRIYNLDV
jgi:hypothetical protein